MESFQPNLLAVTESMTSNVPAVLLNDTRSDYHYGCARVIKSAFALADEFGIHIRATSRPDRHWRSDAAFTREMEMSRLVIVNGEAIHHDLEPDRWLLEVGEWAQHRGIPAVLINATWQANGPEFHAMLRHFALVSVRESSSAAELRAVGIACRVVPDLVLYLPHERAVVRKHIGFTDSAVRELAVGLEAVRVRLGALCVPIQYSEPGLIGAYRFVRGFFAKRDLLRPGFVLRGLRMRLREHAAQAESLDAYLDRIATLQLLVSGRFHAINFALVTGTPVLAVESRPSNKVAALITDAGLEPWRMTSPNAITSDLLLRASHWSAVEERRVSDYLATARDGMRGLFEDIRRLA